MPKCALCLPKCSQAVASTIGMQRFEHDKEKSEMDFGTWKAKFDSEGGCVFLLGRLAWVERGGENCLAAEVQLLPLRGDSNQVCCSLRPGLGLQGCCRRKITTSCSEDCLAGGETVKQF